MLRAPSQAPVAMRGERSGSPPSRQDKGKDRSMDRIICKVAREASPEPYGEKIEGPADVADAARIVAHTLATEAADSPAEMFAVFHLSAQNHVIGWEVVTRGLLDCSLIHPREVFRSAIVRNAAALIVAHNHPSGQTEPSAEDLKVTRQLSEAGHTLGIPVLDHIIIGHDERFSSMAGRGVLAT